MYTGRDGASGCLQSVLWRLRTAWISAQVELHGRYSIARLNRLKMYMDTLSTSRMLAICLLTPLPCIVLAILIETLPLAPAQEGVQRNWVFLVRFGIITFIMVGTLVFQMGKSISGLTVQPRHIIVVGLSSALASVGTVYVVAWTTVFPVPFTMLLASPPSIVVFGACFVYFWGAQVRVDPSIEVDMKRDQAVSRCQVALTFIYPLYISGFVSLSGIYQTMFVALLPIIKLFARNWVAHGLKGHNDQKPQAVTFIVEVFSALYVSNALSNSSSWEATAFIMTVDIVVFCLSARDIMEVLNDVELLMEKIPQNHSVAHENFVQAAIRLAAIEAEKLPQYSDASSDSEAPTHLAQVEKWISSASISMKRDAIHAREKVFGRIPKKSQRLAVRLSGKVYASAEFTAQQLKSEASDGSSLQDIFSREERALFIHQTTRVLFITEFIILAEYVEVILPVAYGLHHITVYHLPNCVHYPGIASLPSSEFSTSILTYCFLEFLSLVLVAITLGRILGFSTLRQLAFVLEKQAGIIQTQLVSLLLYIMQISLAHIGADFTFKFAWLHDS